MLVLLLCCLCILSGVKCQGGPPPPSDGGMEFDLSFMGPVTVCDDDLSKAFVDTSQVELTRYDDVAVMTGHIGFFKSFEDSTMLEVVLEKETNGRYEKMLTHELHACEEIKNPDSNYAEWIKFFGLPSECPFEPGLYPIHNLTADKSDLPINSANAGVYQATTNLFKCIGDDCDEKIFLGCMKLDFCIEPV